LSTGILASIDADRDTQKLALITLLIPGLNDSSDELKEMSEWVVRELGNDVPMHFSAFHPDYKMNHIPPTHQKP